MYFNANGERISHARWKELYQAFKDRQQIIRARLSRSDLCAPPPLGTTRHFNLKRLYADRLS